MAPTLAVHANEGEPTTMPDPRLATLAPATLDGEQRALYDAITAGPRAGGPFVLTDSGGGLVGPFNAMLLSPPLGEALQALGAAVRYRSVLSDRAREIAILIVAWVRDCAFEIYAHEAVGRAVGLGDAELAAIREGRPEALADGYERLVAAVTRALATRSDLTDEEYSAARDGLGERAVFELTTLVGYYTTLALQLRAFRVGAPDQPS
jgi:4-carboxymuconolactone decarboxylase